MKTVRLYGRRIYLSASLAVLTGISLFGVSAETPPDPAEVAPASFPQAPPGAKIADEGWFAPITPGIEKPVLPDKVTKAVVITIREAIASKTFRAIKRKIIRSRTAGAELIIFDMDTWGGGVIPALDIARLIKTELDDVYTICYVRTRGVSAGALIALSCDEIVMTPSGKLGDSAPISMGEKLEGIKREKMETVLRTEFAESAERNGYPVALAESMVTISREVWLVRNIKTRELRYVLRKDYSGRVSATPGTTTAPSNPKADWEVLRTVVQNTELLTLTPKEALQYGFVSTLIKAPREDPLSGVLARFNVTDPPLVLEDNWSEELVGFLASAPVMGFLFFAAIVCAYIEMHTPGFGVAGTAALICLSVIFGSRFLIGMAAWWEIALFAVGLILLAVEVFITPGFGVLGISGVICCVAALLAMIVPNAPDKLPIPDSPLTWSLFKSGATAMLLGFLGACAATLLLARFLPKIPIASRLILATPKIEPSSPADAGAAIRQIGIGEVGLVEGPCRPVGKVRFGDTLADAIAEGGFLEAGEHVTVVKIEGNRVIVTPVA